MPIRAAQYLRMSTEHQRYSLENQAAAIAVYALARGYEVVRTYTDSGKSGLTLKGRDGLKQLLADVVGGGADYSEVLVLDVSRWGRFQDPDQSAHYEFICREAGVGVRYCGEPFENDGTVVSTIVKHLKRVMAGEYSRELSEKIKAAKRQQARLGFKQGNAPTYGVRRLLVDEHGQARFELRPGQTKAVGTDRVRLVQGPADEVDAVRAIFRMFVRQRRAPAEIGKALARLGAPSPNGRAWTSRAVRSVLANELYTGVYVFGRTSRNMSREKTPTAPETWIRVKVMEPIVSEATFKTAERLLRTTKRIPLTDEDMLARLGRLYKRKGRLSARLLKRSSRIPSATTYRNRFGELSRAYEAVGFRSYGRWARRSDGRRFSNGDLLEGLRHLHVRHGYLSGKLIDEDPDLPAQQTVRRRLGPLMTAYALAGFPVSRADIVASAHHRHGRGAYWRGQRRQPDVPRKIPKICNADGSQITRAQLLDDLRALHATYGYVSERLIAFEPGIPTVAFFRRRFGGLRRAYELAGLPCKQSEIVTAARQRRREAGGQGEGAFR